MTRMPIVGVPCDRRMLGKHPYDLAGEKYVAAVRDGSGALPLLIPVLDPPLAADDLLNSIDGLLFTGSSSNVAPRHYGGPAPRTGVLQDEHRDATALPLLKAAIAHVAHYQIRNRGTVGGSIAHADPAAEMPGIAVACDAEIAVVGAAGSRTIRADDFFIGPLTTALTADEIIVEIHLPAWPAQRRWGFREFSRRRGDFATAYTTDSIRT